MSDDVKTVRWEGHKFGGRRAAVEYVGHLPRRDRRFALDEATALEHSLT